MSSRHSFGNTPLYTKIFIGFILIFSFCFLDSTFAVDPFKIGSNGASYQGSDGGFSIGKNGGSANVNIGGVKLNISSGSGSGSSGGGGPIFDGPGLGGGARIVERGLDKNLSKESDIKALIIAWTNFLLPLAAVIAVLAIVWAGFLYITSFGDDGRIETAKKIIIWVFVGIIVIAGAYAIVSFFMDAVFK